MQADRQKFASAAAPGICLICPLITRQVAFLQRERGLKGKPGMADRHSHIERNPMRLRMDLMNSEGGREWWTDNYMERSGWRE